MGADPLTLGLLAGSQVIGAVGADRANARNTRAQQQLAAQQRAQQMLINSRATGMMQNGPNPFAQMLMDRLNNGGFAAPQAVNYNPISSTIATGSQGFNAGQDGFMQMLRNQGNPFDTSSQFAALEPQDQRLINSQVAGLRGSSGSLGQRFGTSTLGAESRLRGNFAQDIAARNAGIRSSAYESAQGRVANAAGALQQGGLQQSGLLAQIAQANAGNALQAGQFNAGMSQNWNQFISSIIGQAGGFQQNQNAQNAQLLGIMAGAPGQQGTPNFQPSQIPGAFGDLGQLMLLLPYLSRGGGGGATPYGMGFGSPGLTARGY